MREHQGKQIKYRYAPALATRGPPRQAAAQQQSRAALFLLSLVWHPWKGKVLYFWFCEFNAIESKHETNTSPAHSFLFPTRGAPRLTAAQHQSRATLFLLPLVWHPWKGKVKFNIIQPKHETNMSPACSFLFSPSRPCTSAPVAAPEVSNKLHCPSLHICNSFSGLQLNLMHYIMLLMSF